MKAENTIATKYGKRHAAGTLRARDYNDILKLAGYGSFEVSKAEGVWYLLGDDPRIVDNSVERCLHETTLTSMLGSIKWKLVELTGQNEDIIDTAFNGQRPHVREFDGEEIE